MGRIMDRSSALPPRPKLLLGKQIVANQEMAVMNRIAFKVLQSLVQGTDLDKHHGKPPDHKRAAKFCYDAAEAMMAESDARHKKLLEE